jgi:hypothetical protein
MATVFDFLRRLGNGGAVANAFVLLAERRHEDDAVEALAARVERRTASTTHALPVTPAA